MKPHVSAITISCAALAMASCGGKHRSAATVAREGTGSESRSIATVHGIGYVEPHGEVRHLVFRYPGIIEEVAIKEGQMVEKGDLLMRLHSSEELANVLVASAKLAAAEAKLEQVLAGVNPARIDAAVAVHREISARLDQRKRELARQEALSDSNATTTENREAAHSLHEQERASLAAAEAEIEQLKNFTRAEDRKLAEADVQVAEAVLNSTRSQLAEMELRAPINGQILDVSHRPGDATAGATGGNEAVGLIGETSKLMVRAEIDQNFALLVSPGQAASVLTPGRDARTLTGTVVEIMPMMGRKTLFSRLAHERRDIDVRQVLIELDSSTDVPVGLKVDVAIDTRRNSAEGGKW